MGLKKEMFLAITFGLILGVVAAFAIARTPKNILGMKDKSTDQPKQEEVAEEPTSTPAVSSNLEILIPDDQAFVQENEVTVSGKSQPQSTIIITTPFDENVVMASDDGTFSSKISLEEGPNEILVVSLKDDKTEEKTINVNYTKEEV